MNGSGMTLAEQRTASYLKLGWQSPFRTRVANNFTLACKANNAAGRQNSFCERDRFRGDSSRGVSVPTRTLARPQPSHVAALACERIGHPATCWLDDPIAKSVDHNPEITNPKCPRERTPHDASNSQSPEAFALLTIRVRLWTASIRVRPDGLCTTCVVHFWQRLLAVATSQLREKTARSRPADNPLPVHSHREVRQLQYARVRDCSFDV